MKKSLTAIIVGFIALLGLFAVRSFAQPASRPVAVLVEIPRPANLTNETLEREFARATSTYNALPGLERKYFTYSDRSFGGVYLWRDKASATAFFNDAWHARIGGTYGRPANLTWFDVPQITTGAAPQAFARTNVVSIVKVKSPWYATNSIISGRFRQAVPIYAGLQSLVFKYFSIGSNRTFGGIYLWDSQVSADAFFNEAWRERIKKTYGKDAELAHFNAPVSIINTTVQVGAASQ